MWLGLWRCTRKESSWMGVSPPCSKPPRSCPQRSLAGRQGRHLVLLAEETAQGHSGAVACRSNQSALRLPCICLLGLLLIFDKHGVAAGYRASLQRWWEAASKQKDACRSLPAWAPYFPSLPFHSSIFFSSFVSSPFSSSFFPIRSRRVGPNSLPLLSPPFLSSLHNDFNCF